MIGDIDCLHQLYPQVVSTRGDKAFDADGNEVAYDRAAVQALADSYAYQQKRAKEYPSITDQFDTIFHEGLDVWKAQIQAIKDKYPKS
jgi:hypothetical protein